MTTFVDFCTSFTHFTFLSYINCIITQKEVVDMKNKNATLKNGIKNCLTSALKANANSTGCFVVYQPKAPKALNAFKKIK